MTMKVVLLFLSGVTLTFQNNFPTPEYQWPLGSKSLFYETMGKVNFYSKTDGRCYIFKKNTENLPYEAFSFGSDAEDISYLEANIRDDSDFKNLSISMYVYPNGRAKGTLLHYVLGPEEKIRINFILEHTVVSFRDEYANPTGLVATENLLKDNEWNHLYVERQFESGRIKIYLNGVLKVNANDDFQKNIPMPTGGKIVIGNAVTKNSNAGDQQFDGYITCIQIYTKLIDEVNINNTWKNCLPERWRYKPPDFYLIPNGNAKCISNSPPTTPTPDSVQNLITRSVLSNENKWEKVRQKYNWRTSARTSGYFRVKAHNGKPRMRSMSIVNSTDTKVCTRLCMRIDGCQSFAMDEKTNDDFITCQVYDSIYGDLVEEEGSTYYAVVNTN